MQFNSIPFLFFLLCVVPLYYLVPQKHKNVFLLICSYYFYFCAKPEYLILLLASTAVNYLSACLLERGNAKRVVLYFSLLFNIGLLFGFKYLNFFNGQLNYVFQQFRLDIHIPAFSIILPVGISFYTFMAIGYLLDIYWGDRRRDRNYVLFSLYLAFFPQILCGPIGRAKELIPQFVAKSVFKYDNFSNGFRLMLWGLFKKIVVADNLGVYVDAVFNNASRHSTLTVIVATFLYAFQLYADFSGYTDVARGIARLFGIKLMVNFRTPYVNSTSVTDYWNRNHISLTSWFRDYVYYPFIGTNTGRLKRYAGILLMFLLSGIWHGAGWMFITWGLIQAIYLVVEDLLHIGKKKNVTWAARSFNQLSTFILVSIGLLFFRLPTMADLCTVARVIAGNSWDLYTGGRALVFAAIGLFCVMLLDRFMDKKQFDEYIGGKPLAARWACYLTLTMMIFLVGNIDGQAFIYFQF